jgi:hypothetical protein
MPAAEDSGMWLIDQIADEARLNGSPLSDEEVDALSTPMWDLTDDHRPIIFMLNNRMVPMIRQRIERQKAHGVPTVKVRTGLVLPVEWHENYIAVHNSELPWPVSMVVQNVILNNSLAGERRPWKSK